tara:strand:- start:1571 stop:2119 length:549 start_codon:yes stop_codon:yes gene_type:complete
MIEYYCDPCNAKIFRDVDSTNQNCSTCGRKAELVTEENKSRFKANKFLFVNVMCKRCNHLEEDFMPNDEEFICNNCNHTEYTRDISRPNIERFSEQFPYYDRGMGTWLKNKNHRKSEMKKRNLIEAPGNFGVSDMQDQKAIKEAEEDKKVVQKLEKDMKESPAFAEYRQRKNDINFKHKPRS